MYARVMIGTLCFIWLFYACDDSSSPNNSATVQDDMFMSSSPDALPTPTMNLMPDSGTIIEDHNLDMGGMMDARVTPLEALNLTEPDLSQASFQVHGTVNQIYIWKAPVMSNIEVLDQNGELLTEGETDWQGSLVFRELQAQENVEVRLKDDPTNRATGIEILSIENSTPSEAFYQSHVLKPGRGYITMRDGTQLSIFVSLPGPIEEGPYPTIINYSGYSPSRP